MGGVRGGRGGLAALGGAGAHFGGAAFGEGGVGGVWRGDGGAAVLGGVGW